MEIYYDLSRLMERATAAYPSGVDRVDLRYALWTRRQASAWSGLVQRPSGLHIVDPECVDDLLTCLCQRWIKEESPSLGQAFTCELPEFWAAETKLSILEKAARVGLLERLEGRRLLEWPYYANPQLSRRLLGFGRRVPPAVEVFPATGEYWNVGHSFRFERAAAEIVTAFAGRTVVFLHDVIPLLYPDTQRAVSQQHFYRFCEWISRLGGQLVVSSQSTVADIGELQRRQRALFCDLELDSLIQLPLPVEASFAGRCFGNGRSVSGDAYFVILGAWEPRKNFELLLDVWEQLLAAGGPRIVLKWVGKRGELPRQSAKRLAYLKTAGWVEEMGVVSDREIQELFSDARAMLFPSLAEGWGLPLAEALAAGLPVIASDIAICREVSQQLAEYQDASDAEAWLTCVQEYAGEHSALRLAQLKRLASYRAQEWETYFRQFIGRIRQNQCASTGGKKPVL